jgi:hypothetical protein
VEYLQKSARIQSYYIRRKSLNIGRIPHSEGKLFSPDFIHYTVVAYVTFKDEKQFALHKESVRTAL